MTDQDLSPQQQAMVGIWEKHMAAEFKTKNIYNDGNDDVGSLCQSCTCDDWWVGYNEVRHFYNTYFIPCSRRTQTLCRSAGRSEKTASSTN